MRGLVVNADDFNLTAGVSEGILEGHTKGIVSSTTAMANLPGLGERLLACGAYPELGVGLHLNVTHGEPLSKAAKVPSLADAEGRFRRDPRRVIRSGDRGEIETEFRAQYRAFVEAGGRKPTHLDTHHHLHRDPEILGILLALGEEFGLPIRTMDPATRARARARRVATTDAHVGDVGAEPFWTVPSLLAAIDGLGEGVTELCCHPGRFDGDLAFSRYGRQREVELQALCHPDVSLRLVERGVAVISFADIGRGHPARQRRAKRRTGSRGR